MKPQILAKLERELRDPIASERQVVYILVELRKLIELNQDDGNYPALKFHCDWVAHPILQGTFAQRIVRLADAYQDWLEAHQSGVAMGFMAELGPTLTMSNFRNELNEYVRAQGLDLSIPNEEDKWANFLSYYARVIEDCPLRCVSQGLQYADEVVLSVLDANLVAKTPFTLGIRWSWRSKKTGALTETDQFY